MHTQERPSGYLLLNINKNNYVNRHDHLKSSLSILNMKNEQFHYLTESIMNTVWMI